MNPENEYPYPNWKDRPIGDPTDVIKALRQCRKAVASTCTMPLEMREWVGHFHSMGKKDYRRFLGERLTDLYGSLPYVHRSFDLPLIGYPVFAMNSAQILWNALLNEARSIDGIPFYGIAPAESEPLVPAAEEPVGPIG